MAGVTGDRTGVGLREPRRSRRPWSLIFVVLMVTMPASAVMSAGAVTTSPKYLLALGDSLAAGYQPLYRTTLPPKNLDSGFRDSGYPNSYAAEIASTRGLVLVDLACPGETSTSMLGTPAQAQCATLYKSEFGVTSQMAAARSFLSSHTDEVGLVTLDIGANDLDRCFSSTSISTTCLRTTNSTVVHNLGIILSRLMMAREKSNPAARLIGMNYYDPFLGLAFRPGGTRDTALAVASVAATNAFNVELTAGFHKVGASRADVAEAFQTDSALPIARFGGKRLPIDVVDVCTWTWMCPRASAAQPDVHPNDVGYQVIASAFERVISS